MAFSRRVGVLGVALLLSACGGSSVRSNPESGRCEYGGESYDDGASFAAADGCNTCSCEAGNVSCTQRACVSGCTHDGQTYEVGATFTASDGCNRCRCDEAGLVACTMSACFGCDDINAQYGALMSKAKACDPSQPNQCNKRVIEGLSCGCETFVNPSGWDGAAVESVVDLHRAADCSTGVTCGPCNVAVSGSCSPEGVCVTDSDPKEGVACKVNGTIYPNGATNVPDPASCNTCTCDEGRLVCTEIGCPMPCPDNTRLATNCAECAPTDACLVIETGCFPSCTDTCDSGSCLEGTCRTLCG